MNLNANISEFGAVDVGPPDMSGGLGVDDIGDLLAGYYASESSGRINIPQIIVNTLVFLSVVAWVQFFFIQMDNIDSLQVNPTPLTPSGYNQRRNQQLRFAILLTITTIILYIIYSVFFVKKK